MKSKATTGARILLGLVFFFSGLNGFLHFIPQPPLAGPVAVFMGGLAATRYFFPLLAATQTISGAALLSGRFVPLALTVLAPVIVNIVAFHLFVSTTGLPMAFVVFAIEVFLAWSYRSAFLPILRAHAEEQASVSAAPAHGARPESARTD
jgi:uncharacterized membrane protein YphA (DoxX/SURF4 family)